MRPPSTKEPRIEHKHVTLTFFKILISSPPEDREHRLVISWLTGCHWCLRFFFFPRRCGYFRRNLVHQLLFPTMLSLSPPRSNGNVSAKWKNTYNILNYALNNAGFNGSDAYCGLKTKKWALGKKHDKKKKKNLVSKALNNVFLNSPSHLIAVWVTTASFDHSKKKKNLYQSAHRAAVFGTTNRDPAIHLMAFGSVSSTRVARYSLLNSRRAFFNHPMPS